MLCWAVSYRSYLTGGWKGEVSVFGGIWGVCYWRADEVGLAWGVRSEAETGGFG